jgi:hypothetical protein
MVYVLLLGMILLGIVIVAYQRTVNPTHAVTLDADGIAHQLQGMTDLVTVKYVVQKLVAPHGEADPSVPMFMVQATVSAAVDLKEIQGGDVTIEGDAVDIRLPGPRITNTSIDESQTQVWDRDVKMWTVRPSFDTLAVAGVRKDAEGWVDRQAEQSGIFADATLTAQRAISRILVASGMAHITFRQKSAAPAH